VVGLNKCVVVLAYFNDLLDTPSIQMTRPNREQETVIQYSNALLRFNSSCLARAFSQAQFRIVTNNAGIMSEVSLPHVYILQEIAATIEMMMV
jgi:hypothetical protein